MLGDAIAWRVGHPRNMDDDRDRLARLHTETSDSYSIERDAWKHRG